MCQDVSVRSARPTGRRDDALSRERIVSAAIEILDTGGESALTFRALAGRLATGSGAIYWHIANKNELLAAATDSVIGTVVTGAARHHTPHETIRSLALGIFDAFDAHPWVGTQLTREPWESAMLEIFEGIGRALRALAVPDVDQFNCATALLSYILGAAGQNAANARMVPPGSDRAQMLATAVDRWTRRDPAQYPFVHQMAAQLRDHDDRDQYLAGIDLILAGIDAIDGSAADQQM